jgi:hypothetical protein
MSLYKYIKIEADRCMDPDLFNELVAIPEMVEVHMANDTAEYYATVDDETLAHDRRLEDLFRKIMSVRGVRRVGFTA